MAPGKVVEKCVEEPETIVCFRGRVWRFSSILVFWWIHLIHWRNASCARRISTVQRVDAKTRNSKLLAMSKSYLRVVCREIHKFSEFVPWNFNLNFEEKKLFSWILSRKKSETFRAEFATLSILILRAHLTFALFFLAAKFVIRRARLNFKSKCESFTVILLEERNWIQFNFKAIIVALCRATFVTPAVLYFVNIT